VAVTVLAGELVTGRRLTQVPLSALSWSVEHRGSTRIDVTIPLAAEALQTLDRSTWGLYPSSDLFLPFYPTAEAWVYEPSGRMRPEFLASIEPWRCFLAVLVDDVVVAAGPIQPHTYDPVSRSLSLSAVGMDAVFARRTVVGAEGTWPGGNPAAWSVTYSGLSLGTIAKRLVQLGLAAPGGGLPVVLPADEAGAHERTYHGYEMGKVWERITQIMGVESGPDVRFSPRLQADRKGVEWALEVGTSAQPMLTQAGSPWVFDAHAVRGSVAGMSVQRDPSALASRAFVTGDGMETSLLVERATNATLTDQGFPALDSVDARSTVSQRSTLASYAAADVRRNSRPYVTWGLTVKADQYPRLGQYRPGDFARVWTPKDDPYLAALLPQGNHTARIVRVSGDATDFARVDFAPVLESR
jgi:hypothetical protein